MISGAGHPRRTFCVIVTLCAVFAACGSGAVSAGNGDAQLIVRVAGTISSSGDRMCPADGAPCLALRGDVVPDAQGRAEVEGRVLNGELIIDRQMVPPPVVAAGYYDNQCAADGIAGPPPDEWMAATEDAFYGPEPRLEGFAELWDADDGTVHLAVAGDLGAASAFLAETGAAGDVCVVEVSHSYPQLSAALKDAMAVAGAWDDGVVGGSVNPRSSSVTIEVERVDAGRRAEIKQVSVGHGGVNIEVRAPINVLTGSLADYDAATVGSTPVAPASELTARCSDVVFSAVPPNLDEFPPVEGEAWSALEAVAQTGEGFIVPTPDPEASADAPAPGYDWSVAFESDTELVLLGQNQAGGLASASFERRDGDWTPRSWGGCSIRVEAPGHGPAQVHLDPARLPDPTARSLGLFVTELACASGQGPEGRAVIPIVNETASTVELTVLVESVRGGAECPGNPLHPISVELNSPLGDRVLLDAHRHPPTVITEP